MKTKLPGKNEFFDINKFPAEAGALIFPFSMARLNNGHLPLKVIENLKYFMKKIDSPKVGVNFIYTDFLYLYDDSKASKLKKKFTELVFNHSNALKKLINKNRLSFQIQHAFSYLTWSHLYLLTKNFQDDFIKLKKIYNSDKLFKKYLRIDTVSSGRKLTDNQVDFLLEEYLLSYYIIKGQIKLPNEYIQGADKWFVICYPGDILQGWTYLIQKNFFKLPQIQKYEGHYNLDTKKFIDCHNVDLETYSVK